MFVKHIIRTFRKQNPATGRYNFPGIKNTNNFSTAYQDDYIKGSDKFPLDKNRWGYLPIAIQKYLQTDNKKCQISITNTNLKPNHLCLLRRGVEFNKNQSFISCLSDLYIDYMRLLFY